VQASSNKERATLHTGRHVISGVGEQSRRYIQQSGSALLSAGGQVGSIQDEGTELSVVAGVRSGVILFNVNASVTNTADGAPVKSAEVNDEVGRDVAHVLVDLSRLEDK